jgi:hypothetical protein
MNARQPQETGAPADAAAPPLACNLGALSAAEQHRRADLATRVLGQAHRVLETADGFAVRLDADPAVCREVLDWLLLERRCCPFLRFELRFEVEDGPLWLGLGGAAGVKEFLAANGLSASQSCSCS